MRSVLVCALEIIKVTLLISKVFAKPRTFQVRKQEKIRKFMGSALGQLKAWKIYGVLGVNEEEYF